MAKAKPAHHRGEHQRLAKACTDQADADPTTRCRRCRRTIAEVRRTKPGAYWCAGHLIRGQVGGPYGPECSECSGREGAAITNAKRSRGHRVGMGPLAWR